MENIDDIVEDIFKIRNVRYIENIFFNNNRFLSYERIYEGKLLKDIVFSYMGTLLVESEISINIIISFDSMSISMDFFNDREKSWLEMTAYELSEKAYMFLINKYGADWKDGLSHT